MHISSYSDTYNFYRGKADDSSKQIINALNFDYEKKPLNGSYNLSTTTVYKLNEEENINLALTSLIGHRKTDLATQGKHDYITLVKDTENFPLVNSLIKQMEEFTGISRNHPDYEYETQIILNSPATNFHVDSTYYTALLSSKSSTLLLNSIFSKGCFKGMKEEKLVTISQVNIKLDSLKPLISPYAKSLKRGRAVFFKGGKIMKDKQKKSLKNPQKLKKCDKNAIVHASPAGKDEPKIENCRKVLAVALVDRTI